MKIKKIDKNTLVFDSEKFSDKKTVSFSIKNKKSFQELQERYREVYDKEFNPVIFLYEVRHEGTHYRSRGAQHPRARGRDGRRLYRRRHTGGDHRLRFRSRAS